MSIRTLGTVFATCFMVALFVAAKYELQSSTVNGAMITTTPVPPKSPMRSPTATANPFPPASDDSFVNLLDASIEYRVAFLPRGETLPVLSGVGDGEVLAGLENGAGVSLTGDRHIVDGQPWVGIHLDDGQIGWVPRNSLVGNLDRELFCMDPRIRPLFIALEDAVQTEDGQALSEMVSPRGLYMGFFGGRAILINPDEISGIFADDEQRNWDTNGLRQDDLVASLVADVLPILQKDLLSHNRIIACNDTQDLLSTSSFLYALRIDGFEGYDAITNFYSVMRPGSLYFEMNWSAWGLAFEYWDGQPRLMGLAHYRWTP